MKGRPRRLEPASPTPQPQSGTRLAGGPLRSAAPFPPRGPGAPREAGRGLGAARSRGMLGLPGLASSAPRSF